MRILYIANAFAWGGAEKVVFDLAMHMHAPTEQAAIAVLYASADATEKEMVSDLNRNGISTCILEKRAGKDHLAAIWKLAAFCIRQRITVIHAHCSVPMLFGKIVGTLLHIPVVCTIHNTKGYSKRREKLTQWMVRRYIAVGEAAERYMTAELGIPAEKITRICNAIDARQFPIRKKTEGFWQTYGGKTGETVLLQVARVHEQKNQMCLLRAVNACLAQGQKVHAYILGAYHEEDTLYRELKRYIGDKHLNEHVTFLGVHRNVDAFLTDADCFVMTSWYEGLSVAFLEAVACGLPIVATDMPFVRELMTIGKCATVIPQNDDAALAEILLQKKYTSPTAETVQRFRERFSVENFAAQHRDVYGSILKR